jgi:Ser/Thr protein kinase RdoA (MazF antagonist)
VPDNGYRYRTDAPIEEYFHNWGQILGQMHALTKQYHPESDFIKRPEWFDLHKSRLAMTSQLPDRLHRVQAQIQFLLDELKSLPKDRDSYGLIHGDFNDGNFTVDYTNGDISAFDFDDSCYFWFMYEIASAWEGGIGRTTSRGLTERKAFMERYMDQVMEGYNHENWLSVEWLERLPLFTKLIMVEEFLHYAQYINDPNQKLQGRLNYKKSALKMGFPIRASLMRYTHQKNRSRYNLFCLLYKPQNKAHIRLL